MSFFSSVLEEEHQGEASLHRAYCGDDEFRLEVHVEESLCEFCSVLLEHRNALDGRVLVGYPASERGTFGLDAYRCGRQAGVADFKMDEVFSCGLLKLGGH